MAHYENPNPIMISIRQFCFEFLLLKLIVSVILNWFYILLQLHVITLTPLIPISRNPINI